MNIQYSPLSLLNKSLRYYWIICMTKKKCNSKIKKQKFIQYIIEMRLTAYSYMRTQSSGNSGAWRRYLKFQLEIFIY